jgi:hypothetical protein
LQGQAGISQWSNQKTRFQVQSSQGKRAGTGFKQRRADVEESNTSELLQRAS